LSLRRKITLAQKEIMKRNYVLFGLILTVLIGISSCKKDDVEDLENLPTDEVEGDVRDRFIGKWTVAETSKKLGKRNFVVNVTKDDQYPAQVNISNFYNIGVNDTITANVSSVLVSTITVPDQVVSGSHYGGKGEMENDQKINFSYQVDDGTDTIIDVITAVFIR
jgi:hypothetical protein